MMHVSDSVYTAVEDKRATTLVVLDISAEFDKKTHVVLLQRLQTDFSAGGAAITVLHSYFADRQKHEKLGQHSSATQGSVLVPLLFTGTCHQSAISSSHMVRRTTSSPTTRSCSSQ